MIYKGLFKGIRLLFRALYLFNCRKINPALTIAATAFFCKQAFINKPANIKHGGQKKQANNNYLDDHVTNLIQNSHILRTDL